MRPRRVRALLDLRSAVQQEIVAEPALVSFGIPRRSSLELEQVVRIRNLSTRGLTVSIQSSALAPKGVQISFDPQRLRIRAGRSATVVVRANTSDLSDQAGAATGELVLAVSESPEVHVPWAVAVPGANVDLLSRVRLEQPAIGSLT